MCEGINFLQFQKIPLLTVYFKVRSQDDKMLGNNGTCGI